MYQIASSEPAWLELFPAAGKRRAVRGLFAPVSRAALRAATQAARLAQAEGPEDLDAALDVYATELIRRGLRDWEEIAGPDGKALAFTAAGVEQVLADPGLFAAANAAYVEPYMASVAEKNDFSGSRAGTSAGRTAARPTAPSAATPAKTARTRSTPRKR